LFIFQKYLGGNASGGGIPVWVYYSFFLGSFCSIASVVWSVYKTPEIPPSDEELEELRKSKEESHFLHHLSKSFCNTRYAQITLAACFGLSVPMVCTILLLAVHYANAQVVAVWNF
jgi:hypothetical protein